MSMQSLTLMEKLEDLDTYSHQSLHQFPKLEKHLLCADIRASLNYILQMTVTAWKRRKRKSEPLLVLDVEIEMLRSKIRKAHRLDYIKPKKLVTWIDRVNEIGRIVGTWLAGELEKEELQAKNQRKRREAAQ